MLDHSVSRRFHALTRPSYVSGEAHGKQTPVAARSGLGLRQDCGLAERKRGWESMALLPLEL
jgi:hypothetical protein